MYNARLGARRRTGGGGARVARLGWVGPRREADGTGPGWIGRWDWICLSSASSEIVGLGNKNIIKFCQKVARSRIDEVGSPSLNFKFANQKYYKDRRDWPTTIITKCCKLLSKPFSKNCTWDVKRTPRKELISRLRGPRSTAYSV